MSKFKRFLRWTILLMLVPVLGWTGANLLGYMRLQGALRSLREAGFRTNVQDLGPPRVAPEENAAPLYEASLALLTMPEKGSRPLVWKAVKEGLQDLTETQIRELRALVQGNAEALALATRARGRRGARFATSYHSGAVLNVPSQDRLFHLVEYLSLWASFATADGKPEDAREAVRDIVALVEALRLESYVTCQGIRVWGLECTASTIARSVSGTTAPADLRAWLEILPKEEAAKGIAELATRYWIANTAEFLEREPENIWTVWDQCDFRRPSGFPLWILQPAMKLDGARCLALLQRSAEYCEKPYKEAKPVIEELKREHKDSYSGWLHPVTRCWFSDWFFDSRVKAQALIATTRAGLECEIARHESGHYPEKLDTLDPFTGIPLVYKPDQGLILSVGPDGREDTPVDNIVWKLRQR